MARRAGRLTVGFDASIAAVENGKTSLLLLTVDASPKTTKECLFAAETYGVKVMQLPLDKAAFAAAIGAKKPVAVTAICDSGFAKAIRPHCTAIEIKEEHSL